MLAFMGRIHYHQGRDREALPNFERAFTMTYDPQNPDMAVYMNDYGRVSAKWEDPALKSTTSTSEQNMRPRDYFAKQRKPY